MWVLRAQCGDREALELLLRHVQPALHRYLRGLIGARDADDILQEVFVLVFRKLTWLVQPELFRPWLFRIATNKANDLWRSRGRERKAKDGLRRILDPRAPHASVRFEAAEQNHTLAAALDRLPREQREALVLRYYSNMNFTEIARVVGCPVNTALTRVHKGILKLRQLMDAA